MEKNEFKALIEQYKNEMIELFNLKKDNIIEQTTDDNVIDEGQIKENENEAEMEIKDTKEVLDEIEEEK